MKFTRMLSSLQRSTKITLIGCLGVLIVTALILLILMLFPIEPKQQTVTVMRQTLPTEEETTEAAIPETEAPYSLSEWTASVDNTERDNSLYQQPEEEAYYTLPPIQTQPPVIQTQPVLPARSRQSGCVRQSSPSWPTAYPP